MLLLPLIFKSVHVDVRLNTESSHDIISYHSIISTLVFLVNTKDTSWEVKYLHFLTRFSIITFF